MAKKSYFRTVQRQFLLKSLKHQPKSGCFTTYGTTVTFLKVVAPLQYNLHTAIVPWEQGLGFICFGQHDNVESVKVCKIGIVKVV